MRKPVKASLKIMRLLRSLKIPFRLFALVTTLSIVSACEISKSTEAVGDYDLVSPPGLNETIHLDANNSFSLVSKNSSGDVLSERSGVWQFEIIRGGSYVSFKYTDSDGHQTKPIERWLSGIYLGLDEGPAKFYKKRH